MAFAAKNQTNPVTIAATGYKPYIEARALRGSQKKGVAVNKAERNALKIREYWAQQDVFQQIKDYAESHEKTLFRNRWECAADKKSLYSRVQWEMDKITSKMDQDLNRRRNRLTDLLKNEEDMLLKDSVCEVEDEESKHVRMLSRYTELKMQKEAERQKVAEEKKEQQFRNNCEELRARMSRKLQQQTIEDGRKIECERRCGGQNKSQEEALYTELSEKDVRARKQREEKEEELKKQRDVEYSKYITEQMEEKRLEKMRKLREKETEAEIRGEEERLKGLEEEWEKQMKKKKQEETKRGLNECVQEKLKRKSKEVQDDLLEDLFFLKQIMETEEEVKKNEKKKALLKEQQGYLKYLQDQMRQEVEFEKEVDKMYQEELENAWERRRKEWQEEKNKRRQREQDVMQGIKEQIMANVEKARLAASMNQEYAHKIFKEDESERRREADKLRLIRERNTQHQRELIDQIRRKELQLEKDQRVRDQELERLRLAREAEEAKIQKLLSEIQIDKEHPYRVARRECFNECRQKEHDCYPTAYKG